MNTIIKTFDELTTAELYMILRARAEVFVVEQECVYQDLDGIDTDALHVFTVENGELSSYLRIFIKDRMSKTTQIGRVLTVKRGMGLGLSLLFEGIKAAHDRLCAEEIYIEAQVYAIGFYEKAGFYVTSDEFLEDGIPHVKMALKLR